MNRESVGDSSWNLCITIMKRPTFTYIEGDLSKLMDESIAIPESVIITSKCGNPVLLAGNDWNAITETMNLQSAPDIRESILKGI